MLRWLEAVWEHGPRALNDTVQAGVNLAQSEAHILSTLAVQDIEKAATLGKQAAIALLLGSTALLLFAVGLVLLLATIIPAGEYSTAISFLSVSLLMFGAAAFIASSMARRQKAVGASVRYMKRIFERSSSHEYH